MREYLHCRCHMVVVDLCFGCVATTVWQWCACSFLVNLCLLFLVSTICAHLMGCGRANFCCGICTLSVIVISAATPSVQEVLMVLFSCRSLCFELGCTL